MTLCIGTIETPINYEDLQDPAKRADQVRRVPSGRLGVPEDIAEPVCFMASDMARYGEYFGGREAIRDNRMDGLILSTWCIIVNGASLLVDGGMKISLVRRLTNICDHRLLKLSSTLLFDFDSNERDVVYCSESHI